MTAATNIRLPSEFVLKTLLAHDLMAFTQFAFGVVRPGIPYKSNWHLEAVTHKLSQVAEGRIRRLIITLPPRSLKSSVRIRGAACLVPRPLPFGSGSSSFRYSDHLARSPANDFRSCGQ